MKQEIKQQIGQSVQDFRLPRYQEIPDVGLYLEQATKYICRYLSPILETPLTASMISNYVKRGLLSSPVKKQYSRDQVAYLFFIAVAKNVLSLDALACFLRLQERTYPLEKAYDYSAGSWKTSCCSSLRSGRPLNPPTRIPPTKSGCSTAARRRWCRRFTWKNGWKPSQRKKYDKYGSGIPAHEGIPLFRFSECKFLSGKIDFSGCLWDNRTAKSENTRYKRGFHP